MTFGDLLGQEVLMQSIINAVKARKISNAYIFNGAKGCGKKTAARIFAASINCANFNKGPCGICNSCKKIRLNANPDIVYIQADGKSIKIDQIRELISVTSVKPYENPYRVVIIENGDKMNHLAQDAFLKTLEEPEGNNVFIILTENYNSLHRTIISRCQVFNLQAINNNIMRDYLTNKFNYDRDKVEFAIGKSNGIMGRAIEILKSEDFFIDETYYALLSDLLKGKRVFALSIYDDFIKTKEEGIRLLEFLLNFFKNVLLLKSSKDEGLIADFKKEKELVQIYDERMKEEDIFLIIDMIKEKIRFLDFNVSIKNTIDSIFLKILEVFNG